MTLRGRVENGVVVLTGGPPLADGTVVNVIPVEEVAGPPLPPTRAEASLPSF
jgi:hypothetical protein